MALTAAQQKALIAAQLGMTGDATFESMVADLWTFYEDQALIHPQLRYLYTRRDALVSRIGSLENAFDWKEGDVSESRGQQARQFADLLKGAEEQIAFILGQLRGNRGPKVGAITRVAPISREDTVDLVEPSDRAYRGDPLRRS